VELLQKSVSARVHRWFLDQAEQNGCDRRLVCRTIGIGEDSLDASDARVAGDKHVRMVKMAADWTRSIDIPRRGIAGWLHLFPELAGVVCNSGTLREALRHVVEFRDLIGNVDWLLMHEAADAIAFDYVLEGEGRSASCALGNFAMMAALARFYDPSVRIGEVSLSGAPSRAHSLWDEALGARIGYHQSRNRVVLTSGGLDVPFAHFNETLADIHLAAAVQARQRIRGRASFTQMVEQQLRDWLSVASDGFSQENLQERLCELFAISRWSLHRRLQAERTQFCDLLNRARAREAQHLLLRTRLPISEIADRMHFSSNSAFTRFFVRACGSAPSRFRAEQGFDPQVTVSE
jgi:AraC-like DNA-binding protein